MTSPEQKAILGSISRLRGGTPAELAADLGWVLEDVERNLHDLSAAGYVRPLGRGVPVIPMGARQMSTLEVENSFFDLTHHGQLELDAR